MATVSVWRVSVPAALSCLLQMLLCYLCGRSQARVGLQHSPEPRGVGPPPASAAPSLPCPLLTSPVRTDTRPEPSAPFYGLGPVGHSGHCDTSTAALPAHEYGRGGPWPHATHSETATASQRGCEGPRPGLSPWHPHNRGGCSCSKCRRWPNIFLPNTLVLW